MLTASLTPSSTAPSGFFRYVHPLICPQQRVSCSAPCCRISRASPCPRHPFRLPRPKSTFFCASPATPHVQPCRRASCDLCCRSRNGGCPRCRPPLNLRLCRRSCRRCCPAPASKRFRAGSTPQRRGCFLRNLAIRSSDSSSSSLSSGHRRESRRRSRCPRGRRRIRLANRTLGLATPAIG